MEVLIGTAFVVLVASVGGTMAFFRRRGKAKSESSERSYKAGEHRGTVDQKLNQLIDGYGVLTSEVHEMGEAITSSVTWGKANSEGIQRLTDRFDRHMDRTGSN